MPYNMIVLYFRLPYFHVSDSVIYFLHTTSVFSLYIDVVFALSIRSNFTADGNLLYSLKEHCADTQKHFHKLVMFLKTNCDIPFSPKQKVVDAVYSATILYSCESWLGASCIIINTMCMGGIKDLFGVRINTANDLYLAELGQTSLKAFFKKRQYTFLRKLLAERQNIDISGLAQERRSSIANALK